MRLEDEPTQEAFGLNRAELLPGAPIETRAPTPLDGIAAGIDGLDAIVVVDLSSARIEAEWVRADTGLRLESIAPSLRDLYRGAQAVARGLAPYGVSPTASESAATTLTLEVASRLAIVRRIRGSAIASLFDPQTPLGLARLVARRLARSVEHEIAFGSDAMGSIPPEPNGEDLEPMTTAFRAPLRTSIPPPRASSADVERAKKLLGYLEAALPEPHTARLRLALRAGITPLALEHPEALATEALLLIETAAMDMLGLERSELRTRMDAPTLMSLSESTRGDETRGDP